MLPLPAGAKSPPPKGFTGHDGLWPTDEQIDEWVATRPADANLMLRVNYGLIGIDVDAYDAKTRSRSSSRRPNRVGALCLLPGGRRRVLPTWSAASACSACRSDGLPDRDRVQGSRAGRHRDRPASPPLHHHVAVLPPERAGSRWYRPDGAQLPDGQVPRVDDLPELPSPWAEGLSRTVRDEAFDGSAPNRSSAQRERINEERYEKLLLLDDGRAPSR